MITKKEGEIRIDVANKSFRIGSQFVQVHQLRRGQDVVIKKGHVNRVFRVSHEMAEDDYGLFILVRPF